MIIKSTISFILFLSFKTLFLLILLLFFLIIKESNYILSKEDSYWIRPKNITQIPEHMPLLTMLYVWIFNKTFDLTYFRIMNKNKYIVFEIIKNLSLRDVFIRIFLIMIGINKFFLKLLKFIWEKENFYIKIFKIVHRADDYRLIIKIDGKWELNGNRIFLKNLFKKKNPNLDEYKFNLIFDKWTESFKNQNEILILRGYDIKGTGKIHYGGNIYLKDNKSAFIFSDFDKSENNNDYGREVLFNKLNLFKNSKGLLLKENEFSVNFKKVKCIELWRILKGSLDFGYNEDLMMSGFNEKIKIFNELDFEIQNDLESLGVGVEMKDLVINSIFNGFIDIESEDLLKFNSKI